MYHALLDKKIDAVLDELQFQLDAASKIEVVRIAVDLLKRAQEGIEQGSRLVLVDVDNVKRPLSITTAPQMAVLRSYRDTRKRA